MTTTKRTPSPMRMLRAWLFRERAIRGPSAIELDVVDRQVTREEKSVQAAAAEAEDIESKLQHVRAELAADMASAGAVDSREARRLAADLIGVSVTAHNHTQSLDALT